MLRLGGLYRIKPRDSSVVSTVFGYRILEDIDIHKPFLSYELNSWDRFANQFPDSPNSRYSLRLPVDSQDVLCVVDHHESKPDGIVTIKVLATESFALFCFYSHQRMLVPVSEREFNNLSTRNPL